MCATASADANAMWIGVVLEVTLICRHQHMNENHLLSGRLYKIHFFCINNEKVKKILKCSSFAKAYNVLESGSYDWTSHRISLKKSGLGTRKKRHYKHYISAPFCTFHFVVNVVQIKLKILHFNIFICVHLNLRSVKHCCVFITDRWPNAKGPS